jgi:hypothetical protein
MTTEQDLWCSCCSLLTCLWREWMRAHWTRCRPCWQTFALPAICLSASRHHQAIAEVLALVIFLWRLNGLKEGQVCVCMDKLQHERTQATALAGYSGCGWSQEKGWGEGLTQVHFQRCFCIVLMTFTRVLAWRELECSLNCIDWFIGWLFGWLISWLVDC